MWDVQNRKRNIKVHRGDNKIEVRKEDIMKKMEERIDECK